MRFVRQPALKLGFTTQNFLPGVPVATQPLRELLEYAAELQLTFVELRDPDANLSCQACERLADVARQLGVAVAYSNQRGLLDPDFWTIFERGLVRASQFDGPRTIRALCAKQLFESDLQKTALDRDEFAALVDIATRAGAQAKDYGLQLIVEHSCEPLWGDGCGGWGYKEFLQAVGQEVGWLCDTANFFCSSRRPVTADDARRFLAEHAARVRYVHLKSSLGGVAQPRLTANPLPFGDVFRILDEHGVDYVAIELAAADSAEEARWNLKASLQTLCDGGLLAPN